MSVSRPCIERPIATSLLMVALLLAGLLRYHLLPVSALPQVDYPTIQVYAARTTLPTNLNGNPTYRKVNPADAPILIISLTSDSATRGQLYDAASTVLQQKLLQTPGVGDVTVGGGALPAVRIELNPDRVNHYGISLEQIRSVIANSNVDLPKGSTSANGQGYTIGANDTLYAAADYGPLIVKQNGGEVVHISDLGYVREDVENLENYGLSNGKPAVLLIINKQPN